MTKQEREALRRERTKLQRVVDALNQESDYEGRYAASLAYHAAIQGSTLMPSDSLQRDDYSKAFAVRRELIRDYVHTWFEVRPNFSGWIAKNPQQANAITAAAGSTYQRIISTSDDGAILVPERRARKNDTPLAKARYDAARLFMDLVASTLHSDVDKCRACNRYYLRRSAHPQVYCSSRCARATTAKKATNERREREAAEKLHLAIRERDLWESKQPKERNWKKWIASRNPELTSNWLTRAVNQGKLSPPRSCERTTGERNLEGKTDG